MELEFLCDVQWRYTLLDEVAPSAAGDGSIYGEGEAEFEGRLAGHARWSNAPRLHGGFAHPDGRGSIDVGDGAFAEQPTHMAIDADGRIFVTQGPDRGDGAGVLAFAPDGTLIGGFGPEGPGDGQLNFPAGIALDGAGGIYVEDSLPESARIVRWELSPAARP